MFDIGDEVVVADPRIGGPRYGKVVAFSGDEFAGAYPRRVVRTPGASMVDVGIVFLRKAEGEDREKLREWERMHEEQMATYPPEERIPLYAGPEESGVPWPVPRVYLVTRPRSAR